MQYKIYQQGHPEYVSGKGEDTDYRPVLTAVATVFATSGEDAIRQAKSLKAFRYGKGLGRFPVVEVMPTH